MLIKDNQGSYYFCKENKNKLKKKCSICKHYNFFKLIVSINNLNANLDQIVFGFAGTYIFIKSNCNFYKSK